MSTPKDIIHKNVSNNKMKLYRTINDRTLSEEYNSNSPDTKERIKALTCGSSPTSNYDALSKSHITEIGRLETNVKYMNSNMYERDVMAQYGMVSMEFHDKHRHHKNKDRKN